MNLSDPPIDFAALAASKGVRSRRLNTLEEVAPALGEAISHRGPTRLDVMVDGES